MRVVSALVLAFFLAPVPLTAQALPEWYRVYTLEDSFIDMNTLSVLRDGGGLFRVTFRWSFDEPESLGGESPVRYKSRLEVYQLDCASKRLRRHEVTLFDAQGKAIPLSGNNTAGDWRPVLSGNSTESLFDPACRLIETKSRRPTAIPPDVSETEKASKFALAFAQRLERAESFAPLIREFFAPDYLSGYLQDRDTNWLLPLNRDTAAKATRAELRKFHTALLNAAYFGGSYIISKYPTDSDEVVSEKELVPLDVIRLIEAHPYAAAYRGTTERYDYLTENIDSVERLRSYTNLLERIGGLLRKTAAKASDEQSIGQRVIWDETFEHVPTRTKTCATGCLGLPAGTKLFQVNVPVFQLQLTEINGELKIVSIGPYSQ